MGICIFLLDTHALKIFLCHLNVSCTHFTANLVRANELIFCHGNFKNFISEINKGLEMSEVDG